ncbi:MAG: sulfatase [Planctomycetes bacterium]|nr:sulfatase [Planctomycetota bacterium]
MEYRKTIPRVAVLLLICSLAAFSHASETKSPVTKKNYPSLLLITVDTLRADRLPFYGYKRNTAPFLGKLAGEGIVFTNAYSTSSWTVPSVTSLITGVYPSSHGITRGSIKKAHVYRQERIPRKLPNLPEQLRALGYRTYAVTANTHLMKDLGFGRGFDRYACIGFYTAEKVNQTFLKWKQEIESHNGPVFIWLHYFDPHIPYMGRQPWLNQYQSDETEGECTTISSVSRPVKLSRILQKKGPRILTQIQSHYDSEINYCDEHIKKLFQEFPSLEKYAVVFTADHGEEFMEHGKLGHGRNLYNDTVRIPMFVRIPGKTSITTSKDVVSLIDVAPTLLAIAGGKAPQSWQGRALIDQKGLISPKEERYVFTQINNGIVPPMNALIGSNWKLIMKEKTQTKELYNLMNDPTERNNLTTAQPEKAKQQNDIFQKLVLTLPPAPKATKNKPLQKDKEEMLRSLGYIQ